MTAEQPPSGEQWLTYADAADRLGLTLEAIRSLARRQHWPRRSPNAVGGQTWVLVPADRLAAAMTAERSSNNGRAHTAADLRDDRRSALLPGGDMPTTAVALPVAPASIDNTDDRRAPPSNDRRADEILAAVRDLGETFGASMRQQMTDLQGRLGSEKERADRAESRARDAEERIRELQERLDAEGAEHRRVVEVLVARIPVRRSWWPWRRS